MFAVLAAFPSARKRKQISHCMTSKRFAKNPLFLSIVMRRSKVIGNNYGLLYRDVAFLPKEIYVSRSSSGELRDSSTICIEIKAKQGYLNDDAEMLGGVKKCRYCYFQVSSTTNREWSR
jgi:Inositol-pentakisphosphate 2-kinase